MVQMQEKQPRNEGLVGETSRPDEGRQAERGPLEGPAVAKLAGLNPPAEPGRRRPKAPQPGPEKEIEPVGVEADPEVSEKAKRRQFSAKYKLRILKEAESCTRPGELGALLRREGLYSSYLGQWRRQREQGDLGGLSGKSRGRKETPREAMKEEIRRLRRENQRLQKKLADAEAVIDIQKKASDLLGRPFQDPESEEIA